MPVTMKTLERNQIGIIDIFREISYKWKKEVFDLLFFLK